MVRMTPAFAGASARSLDGLPCTAAASSSTAAIREPWEPESTANNLKLIREARERRSDVVPWAEVIETELLRMADLHRED